MSSRAQRGTLVLPALVNTASNNQGPSLGMTLHDRC